MIAALAEIVVGGAYLRAVASLEGRICLMKLGVNPAIIAHLDHPGCLGILKHCMFPGQLFDDFVDGGFDPEQGTAFDAGTGFFFVQYHLGQGAVGQIQTWLIGDCFLGADIGAETALQTSVFLEAQLWQIRIVPQCPRGT